MLWVAALAACESSGSTTPPTPATPAADPAASQDASAEAWISTLGREHALTGKIWSTREARFVDADALVAALAKADHVLLGETHDNADHHRLQARLVAALAEGREAIVFEQIESSRQAEIDASAAAEAADAEARALALAERVDWANSGWPEFEIYAPVFVAAFEAKLQIRGAGVTREELAPLFRGEPVQPELAAAYGLDRPMEPAEREAWLEELAAAHCGVMAGEVLAPMLDAQRLRDAKMASILRESPRALLIAGSGHTRRDRAVPSYLDEARVANLAFFEVDPEGQEPSDYPVAAHDFVWFTPGQARPDPCASLRAKHGDADADADPDADQGPASETP